MTRLSHDVKSLARVLAWIGLIAIVVLSVVPANERPVTGFSSLLEHFAAFALVGAAFALGYDLSLGRLIFLALIFCGGIELLQAPLPTRHARVSDFMIDFAAACVAIVIVHLGKRSLQKQI